MGRKLISLLHVLLLLIALPSAAYSQAKDTTVAASRQYHRSRLFTLIFGRNYRKDWETPVTMPKLDVRAQNLTLVALKGGMESTSMNMATADSVQMVLRTVNKSMKKLMPKGFKNSPQEFIMQDVISASQPYAALTVPPLCDALGIAHATPHLYYVNDSNAFGKYYPYFAGRVCMLEERIPRRPGTKHEEMDAPFTAPQKDNNHVVLQQDVLKARLLDMLFGDWDRHPGQWNWGSIDSAGRRYYYPVPVDRDMVYFNSNGIFIGFIRLWTMHGLRGFKPRISKLYQFNTVARNFDRELLSGLNGCDWDRTIHEVQAKLTDAVIDTAVNRLPAEVLAYRGAPVKKTLKSRRDHLYPAAMKYYKRLSRHVYIMMSDKPDLVRVVNYNGSNEVTVYSELAGGERSIIYRRMLDGATKRVYLVGISPDDKTEIAPHTAAKIKIIKQDRHNLSHFSPRARNMKRLGRSVNTLGQPGFKG